MASAPISVRRDFAAATKDSAQPLLVTGDEGLRRRENTIPPEARYLIAEAIDRLKQLRAATGE